MRKFLYTGVKEHLAYNSQVLTFNGQIITFYSTGKTIFEVANLSYTEQEMGKSSISCIIKIAPGNDVEFTFDWYIDFKGERFFNTILNPPSKKDDKSQMYEYTLIFESERRDLERFIFANFIPGEQLRIEYDFAFIGDIQQFADRFNLNLASELGTRWVMTVSPGVTSGSETVLCSKINFWELLQKTYEIYNLRWRIHYDLDNDRMEILILNETTDVIEISHEFEYMDGLLEIERLNPGNKIITRLSGRGGNKNVPLTYFHIARDGYPADPDRNEHTDTTYYTNILPKAYRDYCKGWNGTEMQEPTGAYTKGVADKAINVWNPVDYINSENIDTYGIWKDCLSDNEKIFPSIQGMTDPIQGRLDEAVQVEQVINDDQNSQDVDKGNTPFLNDIPNVRLSQFLTNNETKTTSGKSEELTINKDNNKISYNIFQTPNIVTGNFIACQSIVTVSLIDSVTEEVVDYIQHEGYINNMTIDILNFDGEFINVDQGDYKLLVEVQIINGDSQINIDTDVNTIKAENYSNSDLSTAYKQTFDIWIKNIWNSEFQDEDHPLETEEEYKARIWDPLVPSSPQGEMTVMWSDGLLASEDYEFIINKIVYDTSVEGAHWKLTLIKSDAELEASGKYLPNKAINALSGDHFFFININLPQSYVYSAENNVQEYISSELAKLDTEKPTFTIKPSKVFCQNFEEIDKLRAGSRIFIKNQKIIGPVPIGFFINSLTIEYKKDSILPEWNLVISDNVVPATSKVSTIEGDVRRLSSSTYSNEQTITALVRQFDRFFLRKDGLNQSSESKTAFNKDLVIGKNLLSKDFKQGGLTGSGAGLFRDASGSTVLEVDKLNIRKTLTANELVINQVTFFGGKYLYSAAGMEVSKVEEYENYYRCFMDTKQGTVLNQFVVNDQAFCQRFAPTDNTVITYYWRLVVGVGPDYIDLSKSDADTDSGIPSTGDNVAQVGNREEANRQSVLIIDQLNGGSVVQYAGIDDYSWTEKNYVGYGVDPSTGEAFLYCYGDMYFGSRDPEGEDSTYLAFEKRGEDEERKLYIKGTMEFVPGSKGIENLDEWISLDQRIAKGEDAYSAIGQITPYYIDLTNENASVACDADGTVIGDLPVSLATVYYGSVVSEGWAFSGVFTGCTGTVNPITGEISVATLTSDNATVVVTASKAEKPDMSATFNITKVKSGQNATIYSVAPSVNVIKITKAGTITPASISCQKIVRVGTSAPVETTDKILKYKINNGTLLNYTGALTITTSWIYIDFLLYDDDGTTLIDKERVPVVIDGVDGSSGAVASLSVTKQVFQYNSSGALIDTGSWFVVCETFNIVGTRYFEWIVNGQTVQNDQYLAYNLIPPASFDNMPVNYKVNVRVGSASGTILATDSISIFGVKQASDGDDGTDGQDAYTIVLSNESHTLPASSAGVVSSYSGSGTDIMVWKGAVQVPYGTGASTFDVSASGTDITPGSASTVSTYIRRYGDHSSMNADLAKITYTIKVRNEANQEIITKKIQSFSKAKGGSDADTTQAKEDMAIALGYSSYAEMEEAVTKNTTIIKNGFINTEILKAFSILTSNLSTSAGLGKRIRLSKDTNALEMYDNSNVIRAKITGETLSTAGTSGSTFSCTDKNGSVSVSTPGQTVGTYNYGGSNILATISPTASNNSVDIPAIDIRFEMDVLNPYDVAVVNAYVYVGSTLIGSAGFNSMDHGAQETIRIPATTISLAPGTHYMTIVFEYSFFVEPSYPGFEITLDTDFVSSTGNINYADNLTEIATNGIRSRWATNKYFEVSFDSGTSDAIMILRNGDYGFRVTSSGFQKMTDGTNWVSASL